ncbi:MAG: carboxypeptidase regulatory-like domain-containing protein [Acidobacteria bacterium]|nr:carboxypeptidase regulatory-like domain-containing protein [Acidobacteriota bacterium]MSO62057.1 carboxypeptidase regulatory-like domain-containing protein [Acidobacteriota bacterium]
MRGLLTVRIFAVLCLLVTPIAASAQTSTISGTVKDASGGVLPGVTVEASSPVLIEKTRSTVSSGSGSYSILALRPGKYTVTFSLPGFGTVVREGIELTSDFTATINVDLKVGTLEETLTVTGESPIVDTQSITQRVVMTAEVREALPTGRNIQAVGIMIPGTTIAQGGGGALSRDVGGSGNLQQSPLQYRGSGDTVQTIEGLRLNNLCAQGAYSGVYWNDASFEEFSYVTGADSAEMGQGGMRVNMVPRDGGNSFRGAVIANYAGESFGSDNCGSPAIGQPCTRANLSGSRTFNTSNTLTNVDVIRKIWDVNPSFGGPILKNKVWFNYTFRNWGSDKTKADAYFDANPSPFIYTPDTSKPGIDDGHITSNAGRISWQVSTKDKISVYHDNQHKYRNHWGIQAAIPPEAAGVQVTPTSYVNVTKWTRTATNRLLLEGGVGIYNQNYTELYQEGVTGSADKVWDDAAIQNARVYNVVDASNNRQANAWPNPADHYSVLRTFMGAASYVAGSHSIRAGATLSNGDWKLLTRWTGDMQPITYNAGVPVSATLRLPSDRNNGINRDLGIYAQDRWSMGRVTLNLGVRFDQFIGETRESSVLASRHGAAATFGECSDGQVDPGDLCTGKVQNWKDISPRVGFAMDVFGNGRTALKASFARYVAGQQIAFANQVNPIGALTATDTRPWTDRDGNGLPLDAAGNIQFNELTASAATPTFGRLTVPTVQYDPDVMNGWGKRGYNNEITIAAQHQLADRVSVNGGYYRRTFGNQTITDDLRYDASSYDSYCITAPVDPDLPGGGGYRVCGVMDLKPAVFALNLPANSRIRFSEDFGGETNLYQGYDLNLEGRFRNGAFLKAGIAATARTFDNCKTLAAGVDALAGGSSEVYADGTTGCHREYGYRPDAKMSGSYSLPWGVQLAGTYQFTRGIQTGGAGPSVLASWAVTNAVATQQIGRNWTGVASRTVQLISEGKDYGKHNLNQVDLRLAKRFEVGKARLRVDFDLYNVLNSSWPYTVNTAYSTSTTAAQWLRPTNALQHRFFKFGANISF